ncbi:hypothetical protein Tco_0548830 [Tanacetum coccineum]
MTWKNISRTLLMKLSAEEEVSSLHYLVLLAFDKVDSAPLKLSLSLGCAEWEVCDSNTGSVVATENTGSDVVGMENEDSDGDGTAKQKSVLMPMANWPPVGAIHVETSNYVAPLQFQRLGVQVAISLDILILRSIGQLIRKAKKFNIHSQLIYSTDNGEILWVHIFGCKRLSSISRKLDASGSNTWDMGMGFKKAPSNELLECSKDHVINDVPGPNKRVDEVFPRDLSGRMENLLEIQKETDIPEYVGLKMLLGIDNRFKKQTKILDSEDSEEDMAISSSRCLISRRRLDSIKCSPELLQIL